MKKKQYTVALAHRIRAARVHSGLTQHELSKAINISRTALSRIENGTKSPTIHQIEAVSEATNVNFEHLVLGHEPLQQALEQIDDVTAAYIRYARHVDEVLSKVDQAFAKELKAMRDSYIDRYGFPDQDYPVKN